MSPEYQASLREKAKTEAKKEESWRWETPDTDPFAGAFHPHTAWFDTIEMQNATKFGNYLRFSIFCLGLLKISRRRREVQWQNWGDFHKKANILAIPANLPLKFHKTVMVIFKMYKRHIFWSREENIRLFQAFRYKSAGEKFTRKKRTIDDLRRKSVNHSGVVHFRGCPWT